MAVGVRNVLAAVGLAVLASSAQAGPPGAAGDAYVIGFLDVDESIPAVFQYDGASGDLVGTFATRNGGQFNGMAWGPNGNLFTTTQQSFGFWRIQEFDGQTGAFLGNRVIHNVGDFSAAKGLTFGPDGDLYVGDFLNQSVMRFDGTTFALEATTPTNSIGTPNGMRFAPNGELLVISGGSNEVRRFDVSGGGLTDMGAFASITGAVQPQDLAFGPNGNLFVSRGTPGGVAEFDGVTGAPLGLFVPAGDTNNGLAFDVHGRLLVSTFPTRVEAYDAISGAPLGTFLTGFLSNPTIISVKPIPAPGALMLAPASLLLLRRRR